MKVGFIGTGTMGSIHRGSQSIVVDNILFDAGSGVVKQMERLKWYTKNIDYLVITHCHADHFFDIPNFLIGRSIRNENIRKLTVIGGKGIRKKIIDILEFAFGDATGNKYKEIEKMFNLEIVELKDGEYFENNDFKIEAYDLEHGNCKPILGYVLEKDGKHFGYATDTTLCDNVDVICTKSDYVCLDATNTFPTRMHMGLDQVIEVSKKYPDKKIFAIHRSDYEHNDIDNVEFPEDGEIIEF